MRKLGLLGYGAGQLDGIPTWPSVKTLNSDLTGTVAMQPEDFGEMSGDALVIIVNNIGEEPLLLRAGSTSVVTFVNETTGSDDNNAPIWLAPGQSWTYHTNERPYLALSGDVAQVLWWGL
jgi:hypothetical protein